MPVRKTMRLPGWNYSQNSAYFLTICAKNRKPIFSEIVGRGILDAPKVRLYQYGEWVWQSIEFLCEKNAGVQLHNWVIMPNHVHLLLSICDESQMCCGASGMPRPTNAVIPKYVSSLKRFTNRKACIDLWQAGYYDHIIRDDVDFIQRWRYIDNNPSAWLEDDYYRGDF